MITPFNPDELFEINENINVVELNERYLIVDDFYKNYNDIKEILYNMSVQRWKASSQSRNFIDYYDCRPTIRINFPTDKSISPHQKCADLIQEHFGERYKLSLETEMYEFNYFKNNIKDISNQYQHFPHRDHTYAGLVYLDDVCSGGTALYDNSVNIVNTEEQNIFYDVSNLEKEVLHAKPNRLIIFKGNLLHGGYIENHNDYLNNWRINQCIFFEPDPSQPIN